MAEGFLIYPFLCLEAVFAESTCLGTKGVISDIPPRSHTASVKMRTREIVGCLTPHFERLGSLWTQASNVGLAFVIWEVGWAWLMRRAVWQRASCPVVECYQSQFPP